MDYLPISALLTVFCYIYAINFPYSGVLLKLDLQVDLMLGQDHPTLEFPPPLLKPFYKFIQTKYQSNSTLLYQAILLSYFPSQLTAILSRLASFLHCLMFQIEG